MSGKWPTAESDPLAIPKSIVTAKGDIIVATASGVVVRLPAGGSAQVLTVDPSAPSGLKWADATGGGGGSAFAHLTEVGTDLLVGDALVIDTIDGSLDWSDVSLEHDDGTGFWGSGLVVTESFFVSGSGVSMGIALPDESQSAELRPNVLRLVGAGGTRTVSVDANGDLATGGVAIVVTSDARLSDERVPTNGSVTAAKVDGTLKPSGSAVAGTEALRALGTGSTQAAAGDDARFPTTGQKNALAGTSGTPGTTNQYVTTQDSRLSDARTPTAHTHPESDVTGLVADLAAKAPLASPALTGNPTAPTPAQGDNDTSIATTAYVQTEAGLLVPKALVDAKGDLLVGTADNTVARKAASGTYGRVLSEDPAAGDGLSWGFSIVRGDETPQQHGLKGTNFPPRGANGSAQLATGFLHTQKIWLDDPTALANVHFRVFTAGATLTSGQCFAGVYSSAGVLLGKSADLSTVLTSTGFKTIGITAEAGQSLAVGGPGVWIRTAILVVGTTMPVLLQFGPNPTEPEMNLSLANSWWTRSSGSGLTALPANLPTMALDPTRLCWAGVS